MTYNDMDTGYKSNNDAEIKPNATQTLPQTTTIMIKMLYSSFHCTLLHYSHGCGIVRYNNKVHTKMCEYQKLAVSPFHHKAHTNFITC